MENTRGVERLGEGERIPEGPACRVEVKENSKGEAFIGGIKATNEATMEDAQHAVDLALFMYRETKKGLGA